MKTVEIKKVNEKQNTLDLMNLAFNNPPREGFDLKEMKARLRVEEAFSKKKDGKIQLEDADFEVLKNCVNGMRWVSRDKRLIEFLEIFA